MATESTANPQTSSLDELSAIENEIPSYRAVSPLAVLALALGLLSLFCFTGQGWLVTAVLAVVFGVLASWRIQKYPDVLTGLVLARLAIVLGLVCGVGSETSRFTSQWLLRRNAMAFADKVVATLNARKTSEALWYMVPPDSRKGLTPEDADKKLKQLLKDVEKVQEFDMAIQKLYQRMATTNQKIVNAGIETADYYDMTGAATVLLEVGPADDHEHAASVDVPTSTALLYLKSSPASKGVRWHVDRILYPYTPKTFKPVQKIKIDDGHNHAGGQGH